MSDQDTLHTQPSLTTTEIMTIILGCEQMMKRSLPPTKVSAIASPESASSTHRYKDSNK